MPSITARELRERLDMGERLLLVDVLFEEQYERRRLPGSVSACVYNVTFLDQMAGLAPERSLPMVVYGAGEADHSAQVAEEKLLRAGWERVYRLDGGIDAWAAAGEPLEGDAPDAPESVQDLERLFRTGDRVYTVQLPESVIGWEGRNKVGSHQGTLNLEGGSLEFLGGRADGEFRLDMRSIANRDLTDDSLRRILVAHLLSDDFFHVERHPLAVLRISRAEPTGAEPGRPNYHLSGMLELRGISRSFSCEATLSNLDAERIALEAHFDLDRTAWGVNYGSGSLFRFLGYHLVHDLVSVRVRLVLG